MANYIPIFTISVLALLSFCFLLKEKRIDSNNTLFFAAIIVLLYIVAALCLTPSELSDKAMTGLISIGSALVGFISHGVVNPQKEQTKVPGTIPDGKQTGNKGARDNS